MMRVKTPINPQDVKERAAKKLSEISSYRMTDHDSIPITGNIVKPVHVSKTDPLVIRITNIQ